MQINDLKISPRKKSKRVGRGGKKGTYSGKGMKGQKARSGFSQASTFEGGKTGLTERTKKVRGFKSLQEGNLAINLSVLENKFQEGEKINRETLLAKKIIKKNQVPKILSEGLVSKKLKVEGVKISQKAREKIEKAGGVVIAENNQEEKLSKEESKDVKKTGGKTEPAKKNGEKKSKK
ncbi:MAG: 50S ribosomal protein L15 [Patescibacteria group bacterium]